MRLSDIGTWFRSLGDRFFSRAASVGSSSSSGGGYPHGGGATKPWDEKQWLDKANECGPLAAPLHRICDDVASVPWHLWQLGAPGPDGKPTRTEVLEHPILDLWEQPNPEMTGISFRYLWQHYYDLLGRVFIRVEYNADGRTPKHLWLVCPTDVKQYPSEHNRSWLINWQGKQMRLEMHEMIWIRRPNPAAPYGYGIGICSSTKDDVSILGWMNTWTNNFFRQGGHIGKVIGIPGLNNQNRDIIQADYNKNQVGMDNAHKDFIVGTGPSGSVSVVNAGPAHKDMDFVPEAKFHGERIRQTLNVPPEVVGDISNSNKATAQAADYIQQSNNTRPRVLKQAAEIRPFIQLWYRDRTLVLEPENPVREAEEETRQKAKESFGSGGCSRNEYRKKTGDDPLPPPLGDQFLVPENMTIMNLDGSIVPRDRDAGTAAPGQSEQEVAA